MATRLPVVGVPGPMQRRLGAITLVGQTPVLLFGAMALWGLASAQNDPRSGVVLGLGLFTTALAVVAAATMRRPFGVTLGWLVQLLNKFEAGTAVEGDIEKLLDLCDNIGGRSFCALADGAVAAVTSAVKHFRPEFEAGYHTPAWELLPYEKSALFSVPATVGAH